MVFVADPNGRKLSHYQTSGAMPMDDFLLQMNKPSAMVHKLSGEVPNLASFKKQMNEFGRSKNLKLNMIGSNLSGNFLTKKDLLNKVTKSPTFLDNEMKGASEEFASVIKGSASVSPQHS